MLELLDAFRIRAAGHPLPLTIGLATLLFALLRLAPWRPRPSPALAWIGAATGLVVTATYVLVAGWYASHEAFFDAAEPTMIAVGWLFAIGQPVYHALDAGDRYAHMYGPLAFAVHGAVLRLAGPSLLVSKTIGVGAALGALAVTFVALQRRTTLRRAAILTGGCALAFLMFRHYTYWTRPEPFLLLGVALALPLADRAGAATGGIGLGLLIGLVAGFKITSPLYLLPALAVLVARTGVRSAAWAIVPALVVGLLPFAWDNVSLPRYLAWVRLSASNGIEPGTLLHNVEWAAFLALPLALSRGWDRLRLADVALLVAIGGIAIAASKPGAGPYHLLPFVPTLAWFAAARWGTGDLALRRPAGVWVAATAIVALAIATAQEASFVAVMRPRIAVDAAGDVHAFVHAHPADRIAMGSGGTDPLTFPRPLLVFASGRYPIDVPAIQEHDRAGLRLPPATIAAMRACEWTVWLIPRGAEPFDARNQYRQAGGAPLFPPAFRQAFDDAYARDGSTRYFDVWRCRQPGAR